MAGESFAFSKKKTSELSNRQTDCSIKIRSLKFKDEDWEIDAECQEKTFDREKKVGAHRLSIMTLNTAYCQLLVTFDETILRDIC